MSKAAGINEAGAINQIITTLHQNIQEIYNLIEHGEYVPALYKLRNTIHVMRSDDRDPELTTRVERLVNSIRGSHRSQTDNYRLSKMEKTLLEWTDSTKDRLDETGYFSFEKWGGGSNITPAQTMKVKADAPPRKNYSENLPSEIL
jgi:hypothetical protein